MASTRAKLILAVAVVAGAVLTQAGHSAPEPNPAQSAPAAGKPVQRAEGRMNVIYLTFDDGPQRKWTQRILDLLDRYDAKATFFQLGRQTALEPELAAEVRRRGHAVGNHTVDHLRLPTLPTAKIRAQILGGPESKCFRPPFRLTDARVRRIAASLGLREVLWDVDTLDWSKPGATKIAQSMLAKAQPGAIILLHDGGGDRSQTLQALEIALPRLIARGYSFHPLPC